MAIQNCLLVVGAPGATYHSGSESFVYVFRNNGSGVWIEGTSLTAGDAYVANSHFGTTLATSDDFVLAGTLKTSERGMSTLTIQFNTSVFLAPLHIRNLCRTE